MNDYELNKAILSHNNGVLFKLFLKQSWLEKKNSKEKTVRLVHSNECRLWMCHEESAGATWKVTRSNEITVVARAEAFWYICWRVGRGREGSGRSEVKLPEKQLDLHTDRQTHTLIHTRSFKSLEEMQSECLGFHASKWDHPFSRK